MNRIIRRNQKEQRVARKWAMVCASLVMTSLGTSPRAVTLTGGSSLFNLTLGKGSQAVNLLVINGHTRLEVSRNSWIDVDC